MKKGLAIIFLTVYLFNLVGYRGLVIFFENIISTQIVTQLDKGQYSNEELIEVKIPYPLPYAANWPDYERFDGEIDIDGMHYNYVKRKMRNDTLYLLCIPNHEKAKLNAAQNEYVKNTNDAANTAHGKKSPASANMQKAFGSDYSNLISDYNLAVPVVSVPQVHAAVQPGLLCTYSSAPFQPPKA